MRFDTLANRALKPFNSLLGETFELVTPDYRCIMEQVSHHPPIGALHTQGKNFILEKTIDCKIKFTGKALTVNDVTDHYFKLFPPSLKGHLIIGETYLEP